MGWEVKELENLLNRIRGLPIYIPALRRTPFEHTIIHEWRPHGQGRKCGKPA
jgi:hypothetical protein